jgi:23S rRNA U2552 (ribose-2'-O)-methylase RlmE/FtsJ
MPAPNASYSITMRVQLDADPRGIGRVTTAVGEAAGTVTAVDVVESHPDRMVVDLTCNARDTDHAEQITKAVSRLHGVETRKVSDRKLSFLHSTVLSPDEAVLGKRAASGSRASGLRAGASARRAPAPGLTAT